MKTLLDAIFDDLRDGERRTNAQTAFEALKSGRKIRCEHWCPGEFICLHEDFIVLDETQELVGAHVLIQNIDAGWYIL